MSPFQLSYIFCNVRIKSEPSKKYDRSNAKFVDCLDDKIKIGHLTKTSRFKAKHEKMDKLFKRLNYKTDSDCIHKTQKGDN